MSRSRRSRPHAASKTRRVLKGGIQKRCMFIQPVDDEGLGNELYRYGMGLGGSKSDMTLCKLPQKKRQHNPVKNYRDLFNGINYEEKNERVQQAKNVTNPANTPPSGNAKIPYASWQGYQYVKDAIDMVKDNLMRNEFEKYKDHYTFHHEPSKTAFMHVRLGDYEATGWALPFTYYDRALELLFEKAPHIAHVMVLSDNIKKCEEHWSSTAKLEFVKGKNELQSLYIMMKCEAGAIISQSTYSSWGAFLGADRKSNHTPQPLIIYPTPWLNNDPFPMKFPDWWTPLSTHQKGGKHPCLIVDLLYDEGLGNKLGIFTAALIMKERTGLPICIMGSTTPHSKIDYATLFDAEKIDRPANIDQIKNIMRPKPRTDLTEFSKNIADYTNKNAGKNIKITDILYQNFKSLAPGVPMMKEMLDRKEFHKEEYRALKADIGQSAPAAFMHVRRGDYTDRGWTQPDSYYIDALKKLSVATPSIKTLHVFSNEDSWCAKHLDEWKGVAPNMNIICRHDTNELHVLYIMSLCHAGAILSGSTFSAWGAMLGANQNEKSTIIYPKHMPQFTHKHVYTTDNPMSFPDRWHGM